MQNTHAFHIQSIDRRQVRILFRMHRHSSPLGRCAKQCLDSWSREKRERKKKKRFTALLVSLPTATQSGIIHLLFHLPPFSLRHSVTSALSRRNEV
ncbi:hypothetical protein L249_7045, partial [Ophiocordyceps polyrhachis-furcata BCC 54312]